MLRWVRGSRLVMISVSIKPTAAFRCDGKGFESACCFTETPESGTDIPPETMLAELMAGCTRGFSKPVDVDAHAPQQYAKGYVEHVV